MPRIFLALLTLALIALAACAPAAASGEPSRPAAPPTLATAVQSARSTATAAPTVVMPTPDLSRILGEQLASSDPAQVDQSMRELTDWLREASGLRAALGSQADEILRMADQVQSLAVQDLLRQLRSDGKPKGRPAPLPPSKIGLNQVSLFEGMSLVLVSLNYAPDLIESPAGGAALPPKESDQTLGENAVAHIKTQSKLTGSKAEMDIQMTVRAEKDGVVYEERATGKITITVCPDAQGNVPLDLALTSSAGIKDVEFSVDFVDHATGHVDDEANLVSIDHDSKTDLSTPKNKNWFTGQIENERSSIGLQFTVSGLTSGEMKASSITMLDSSYQNSSFLVSQKTYDAQTQGAVMFTFLVHEAFKRAQAKWQGGYCVAILVPEGENQRVMAGAETHFTAKVRHKIEGEELNFPVVATLTSGQVSVTPSGTKVPAPATFGYKAPEETGEDATVALVSRSRRGIAELSVAFTSEGLFYRVDQIVGLPGSHLTGTICALDKPFTLDVKGANAAGGTYVGSFKFIPAGTKGGSWTHLATTSCLPVKGCAPVSGGGTYQVEDLPGGGAKILVSQAVMGTGFGTASLQMAFDFDLKPDSGVCDPD